MPNGRRASGPQQPTDRVKPATFTAVDALAPALAAWEQIFTSWFELAGHPIHDDPTVPNSELALVPTL